MDLYTTFSSAQSRTNRIAGLDALRTLAITGVTLFHMFPDTVPGGYLGVSLFFVLTGYLLAYTSFNNWANGKYSVFDYFKKRINRIYPSLIIVILTTIGIYSLLCPNVISAVRPEVLSVICGYNNWWQIAQNADYFTRLVNTSPFTHMWFMGIELQYYLAWPLIFGIYTLIFRMLGRTAALWPVLLLSLLTAALMPAMYQPDLDVTRLYYGTDTRIYALLFGAFLGLRKANTIEKSRIPDGNSTFGHILFGCFLILTVGSYAVLDGQNPFVYQGGMLLMTIIFCLMLTLTADVRFSLGQHLEHPVFHWISKSSYGIFLWQYPVIFLFNHMQWNQHPLYPVAEIAVILLLTIWSDAVSDTITKHELPSLNFNNHLAMATIKCSFLIIITIAGTIFIGFGCKGIAMSADVKASDQSILQERLAANAATLKEQTLPTEAAPAPVTAAPVQINLDGVICIGDSVMLSAASDLQKVLPNCYIDAEVSRYVGGGIPIVKDLKAQGQLGNLVVISLGTNGPIAGQERYEEQTRELISELGPDRQIFWVNTYGPDLTWQNTNNDYLKKTAAENKNFHIIDWYSLISQHTDWLCGDGIHPDTPGIEAYANLVHARMTEILTAQQTAAPATAK